MTDLNKRNTESVFQSLQDMDIRTREMRLVVDSMSQAIATLNSRLINLENTINTLRINAMGNGPTNNE